MDGLATSALARQVRRLAAVYRREGARETALRVLRWLVGRVYRQEDHLIVSRPAAEDLPFPVEDRLEVRSLADRDVDALLALTRNHVANYLRGGYPALVAFLDGELIGCYWWVDRNIDPDHPDLVLHHLELGEGEAYGFYFFIGETYRGGGVSTEFLSRILLEFRRLGYESMLGFVEAGNRPARWVFSLMGFEVTRRITIRRFLSLLVVADRRLLVKNVGRRSRHSFGERLLVSFGR